MLNWYRAIRLQNSRTLNLAQVIGMPTLVVWGGRDVALDPICLNGTERYVRDLRVKRLPGISHWVQQDAPQVVNELLQSFWFSSAAEIRTSTAELCYLSLGRLASKSLKEATKRVAQISLRIGALPEASPRPIIQGFSKFPSGREAGSHLHRNGCQLPEAGPEVSPHHSCDAIIR